MALFNKQEVSLLNVVFRLFFLRRIVLY